MRMYRFKFKFLKPRASRFTEKVILEVNKIGGGGRRKQVLSADASEPSAGG